MRQVFRRLLVFNHCNDLERYNCAVNSRKISACLSLGLIVFLAAFSSPASSPKPEATHFRPIGPGGGGALFVPTISPHNPKRVVVACDMTGSYITNDAGESWRMFNLQGRVKFFAFDPKAPDTIYAESVGLWRSVDGGLTWSLVYPDPGKVSGMEYVSDDSAVVFAGLEKPGVFTALAIDPNDSKILYAASQQGDSHSLRWSKDWGKTWQTLGTLPGAALRVAVDGDSPAANRTVYVLGVTFVSIYATNQWRQRNLPQGVEAFSAFSVAFAPHSVVVIYAASKSALFVSSDGASTWKKLELPGSGATVRTVAASASNPNIAYVSYKNLQEGLLTKTTSLGVARTSDQGVTWDLVWKESSQPAANIHEAWMSPYFGPGNPENPIDMAVSESDPNLVYSTDFGRILRTADGGKNWQALYSTKREDGTFASRGLETTTNYGIHSDPLDPKRMLISYTDIGPFRSENGGESWLPTNNGIPQKWKNTAYWMVFDPDVRGRVWAAMSGQHDLPEPKTWRKKSPDVFEGGICTSEDSGKTWRVSSTGMPSTAPTHILLDPKSPPDARVLYVAAFGRGVYKSTDGGKSWNLKNGGIPGKEPFAYRMTLDSVGSLYLVVARRSTDGSIGNDEDGALYRSIDGAEHWTRISLPAGANGPRGLAVDPKNQQRLYLAAWGRNLPHHSEGGGVFISDNAGKSWRSAWDQRINDQHIYDVTLDPKRPDIVYAAGYESSVWRSADRGKGWKRVPGFNFKWANRVIPDPQHDDMIYITTFGGGVWYGPALGDPSTADEIATPVAAHGR